MNVIRGSILSSHSIERYDDDDNNDSGNNKNKNNNNNNFIS